MAKSTIRKVPQWKVHPHVGGLYSTSPEKGTKFIERKGYTSTEQRNKSVGLLQFDRTKEPWGHDKVR